MFPDMVILRHLDNEWIVDILEPHDSIRDDNCDKAKGLAKFAGQQGGKFGRIQLIRKTSSAAGGKTFKRLDLNREAIRQRTMAITTNSQLDALFKDSATS